MESFLKRKRPHDTPQPSTGLSPGPVAKDEELMPGPGPEPEESTDVKLAILSSLCPQVPQETLLDILIAHNGSVPEASAVLKATTRASGKPKGAVAQKSLRDYTNTIVDSEDHAPNAKKRLLSRKGRTIHLYDPCDVAEHTPCSVIHNFLPTDLANNLLKELLDEAQSFEKVTFKLFENVVSSPHTSSFFVQSYDEMMAQKTDYIYNGARLTDVRRITPRLLEAKPLVQEAVNREIQTRIKTRYPGGRKLRHQSPHPWVPNVALVNCYKGPRESVGWHSDQLTYLGPRAVIGSLSLGVAREFRVRKVIPKDAAETSSTGDNQDAEGQLSIHLPHNSLLVMHAEMQEEWKHCIVATSSVEPHPISGNSRINVTYRDYRTNMHPRFTPRCSCNVPAVLRVVQRKKENFGRYFWMCYASNVPGKEGCPWFQWAQFDDDGAPIPAIDARPR